VRHPNRDAVQLAGDLLRRARAEKHMTQRGLAAAAGVPQSTVARIEGDHMQPSLPLLFRLLDAAGVEPRMALEHSDDTSTGESSASGWSRPVEVPANLSRLRGRTGGVVRLPLSVYSSGAGPEREFNLGDERERTYFYEIVLTNGTADDICRYLNINELLRLWPKLWLPRHVRRAWASILPMRPSAPQHEGETAGVATPAHDEYRPMTLVSLAGHLVGGDDDELRWRLVAEFLEEYRHEPLVERAALLHDEPPSTGSERWDVFLAALAEHLASRDDRGAAAWAAKRHLEVFWFPFNTPAARVDALVHAPAGFRSRGIFIAPQELGVA
jgi:DNA-binding XRE family transcriptional regulator